MNRNVNLVIILVLNAEVPVRKTALHAPLIHFCRQENALLIRKTRQIFILMIMNIRSYVEKVRGFLIKLSAMMGM